MKGFEPRSAPVPGRSIIIFLFLFLILLLC